MNLAPNGKPSNLNAEQYKLVRTSAFKKWFGDWENEPKNASKVVDENGEPLVVYHGTYVENPFYIFDFDKADLGFHFGTYEQAKNRSETKLFFKGSKSNINSFFLNIKSLYQVTDIGDWEYPQRYLDMFMSDNIISENEFKKNGFQFLNYKEDNKKIRNFLIKKYNDKIGFEYQNKYEGKGKSYIVIQPNQIKLADGTNTTFDGNNNDIRFNKGGQVDELVENVSTEYLNSIRNQDKSRWNYDLEKSIEKQGILEPVTIGYWSEYDKVTLIDGHHRLDTAIDLDIKSIPTIIQLYYNNPTGQHRLYSAPKYNPNAKKPSDLGIFKKGGLIAPNGQVSNLTPVQYELVRTKAFKEWFGDWENDSANASKVVDENGEPLVVYHGSSYNFYEFDITKTYRGGLGRGFYFTENNGKAYSYGNFIYAVFLKILNPIIVKGSNSESDLRDFLNLQSLTTEDEIRLKIINLLYDGVFKLNKKNEFSEIVAIYPNQIKLPDGTNTTFDSSNNDIRYNDGGSIPKELYHYTSETNFDRIFDSNILNPSQKYGNRLSFTSDSEYHKKEHGLHYGNTNVRITFDNEKLISDGYSFSQFDHSSKQNKIGKEFEYIISIPIKNVKKYIKSITFFKGNAIVGEIDKTTTDYANKYYLNSDIKFKEGGLIAPNGQVSNLTPVQYELVRTKAFKAWFGDWENDSANASKVVDENGEPLVVYHFTDKKFNTFQLKGLSNGFFFTEYKRDDEFSYTNKPKAYFLNIKRMSEVSKVGDKYWSTPSFENEFISISKKGDSDGIQFIREKDNKRIIVAYYPNQIKLADGSNTTFDGSNDDIRFANGGVIEDYLDYKIEIENEYEYIIMAFKNAQRVGLLTFLRNPYISKNGEQYILVDRIDVREKERGFGLASKMYEFALKYLPKEYKGIASDLKNRVNKNEIPKIYSKFNNEIESWGGYEYHLIKKSNVRYERGGNLTNWNYSIGGL